MKVGSIVNSMGIKMNQNKQLPPIKRILDIEMQERREKRLCYFFSLLFFLLNGHESEVEATYEVEKER